MIFSCVVGRFLPNKGVDLYLKAALRTSLNARFELVGEFGSVPAYDTLLQTLLQKEKGRFVLRGFIPDMARYYPAIDILVHTSTEPDALPTVLLEGMACGRCIIASDVGGVREILEQTEGNILFPPGDITRLVQAMEEAAAYSPTRLRQIGELNRQIARRRFGLQKQIEAFERLYAKLGGDV